MIHKLLAAVVLMVVCTARVSAWGFDAHELIARLSQVHLNPHAAAESARILNGSPLERYATYADAYCRQSGNDWCAAMHYVNTPDGACEYEPARDCADGICVANAMANYTQRLLSNASVDQFLDLALLLHFTQDMSQPLHVGQAGDQGGNGVTGTFFGSNWNLHSVWDTGMPRHRWQNDFDGILDYEKYLVTQIDGPRAAEFKEWTRCLDEGLAFPLCYNEWTSESAYSCCSTGYLDEDGRTVTTPFVLGQGYYDHAVGVMETHILKGAARLASIMNFIWKG